MLRTCAIFHDQGLNACLLHSSLLRPFGDRLQAPDSTDWRVSASPPRSWDSAAPGSGTAHEGYCCQLRVRQTRDAVRFRAERWRAAGGSARLRGRRSRGHRLGGQRAPAAPGRAPEPHSAGVLAAGPLRDPGHGPPACKPGQQRRRPGTRARGRRHPPRPRPARARSLPRAKPASSPQHSHQQLEDPREDQVVAGDGPTPAEQHHPRHGGRKPSGPRRLQPPGARSPWESAACPRLRAGAHGGRALRMRTEPRAVTARPPRPHRCAARGAGALHRLVACVRSLLLFSFGK